MEGLIELYVSRPGSLLLFVGGVEEAVHGKVVPVVLLDGSEMLL
jgi:hypothetical protein